MVILAAGSFISCDNDDPEIIEYEAGMTSFGFYVEDNEGVIVQDYVLSEITGTSITIPMPEEVDKSNLIARFTVTANDVVKVGEVVQESGVTENNFTAPVDYFSRNRQREYIGDIEADHVDSPRISLIVPWLQSGG